MWILGTRRREMFYLYLPGILSVIVAIAFPDFGEESLLYGILATAIIDSGHVYTTAWRTWLYGDEVKTHPGYWMYPLGFFLFFTMWFYFQIPYLWSFVVYATLYHHTRQVYGFSKWYQKLNRRSDPVSDRFLYFFAYFPMIIYHFRPEAVANYYSEKDLFLYPLPGLRDALLVIYFIAASAWGMREYRLWQSGTRELNRLLSVACPSVVYAYCFLVGSNLSQVLFPLLFLHGIAYLGVMEQSLTRTQKRFTRQSIALVTVVITAVVFGLFESYAEENFIGRSLGPSPWLSSFIVGLSLTPLFCHYAFDAIIWRKNHREAAVVFAPSSESSR